MILARHGQTAQNAARKARSPEGRIQGASVETLLDEVGEWQGRAFGLALGRFSLRHGITFETVYSSDAMRAMQTRDLALATGGIRVAAYIEDPRLRELCKGEQEGRLRREVEIDEEASKDWHYRFGSTARGGETAYEAGVRWLDWFNDTTANCHDPTILAFGHNAVTAYGLWLLTHPHQSPTNYEETEQFRVVNGTALLLGQRADGWHVFSEQIVPTLDDYEQTKEES